MDGQRHNATHSRDSTHIVSQPHTRPTPDSTHTDTYPVTVTKARNHRVTKDGLTDTTTVTTMHTRRHIRERTGFLCTVRSCHTVHAHAEVARARTHTQTLADITRSVKHRHPDTQRRTHTLHQLQQASIPTYIHTVQPNMGSNSEPLPHCLLLSFHPGTKHKASVTSENAHRQGSMGVPGETPSPLPLRHHTPA